LKAFGHYQGWSEPYDIDYSMYKHDLVVTDLRILFHQMGCRDWICERVLERRKEFRHLADGMIHHNGNYFAIEYESSQKGKRRYREIFLNYELDNQIKAIIYVQDMPQMAPGISKEASICDKLFFTTFQELQDQKLDTQLNGTNGSLSLKNLLAGKMAAMGTSNGGLNG